jgi:hypothetical protein
VLLAGVWTLIGSHVLNQSQKIFPFKQCEKVYEASWEWSASAYVYSAVD